MKRTFSTIVTVAAGLALVGCAGYGEKKMADKAKPAMESHAHIGHVMTGWNDTPGGAGLLPTAEAEARIAVQHATFAAQKTGDLKWMQTHTRHVPHAVDPSVEAAGPGQGYGVAKAATGVAAHIEFAAAAGDASKNVKLHATHVATSAKNVVERVKRIVERGQKVLEAKSAIAAAPFVREIKYLSDELLAGDDANGDGKVGWQEKEGGLDQARAHMGFMMKGEMGLMMKGEMGLMMKGEGIS